MFLNGKAHDIRSRMTHVLKTWERPYVALRSKRCEPKLVVVYIGKITIVATEQAEKVKEVGKKDSLVLRHSFLNLPRPNIPTYTRQLRDELWKDSLAHLTEGNPFGGFDMVFCPDVDSTTHKGTLIRLANASAENKNAIGSCRLVPVKQELGYDRSVWN